MEHGLGGRCAALAVCSSTQYEHAAPGPELDRDCRQLDVCTQHASTRLLHAAVLPSESQKDVFPGS